ncbi:MAG: helix-turn-helix domain-containing protein [Gaiella sp.]
MRTFAPQWERVCMASGTPGLAARIRARREELSLTQKDLANEVRVTAQHISRVENQQASPSLELIVRISRQLGVTTDYLLTGETVPKLDITAAVRSLPDVSARAKRALLALADELATADPG